MKRSGIVFRQLILLFNILFILTSVVSCSSKPEDKVLGKWKAKDSKETMEFFKDGTVSAVSNGLSLGGSYKFLDKDQIKMEFGGIGALAGPIVMKVDFASNDEVTLTEPNGNVTKYSRVK